MSLPSPRTPEGRAALKALLAEPADAVIALDYDGTLAPIVEHPDHAAPSTGAVDALVACSHVFGTVALITGRPALGPVRLAGLDGVPGLEHLTVLGHYGDERWSPQTGLVGPERHPGILAVRHSAAELVATHPGVLVEDKGISVALHTRRAEHPQRALDALLPHVMALAVDHGLELQHGRLFVEFRAHGTDKGQALRSLVCDGRHSAVLFAGDDLVDAPAMAFVESLRREGTPGINVFVENPEAPDSLRDHADLLLATPADMVAMLAALAEHAQR